MAPGGEQFIQEVWECASENGNEAAVEQLAHSGLEKPQDQKHQEKQHAELRKLGRTNSSMDLPRAELSHDEEGNAVSATMGNGCRSRKTRTRGNLA